MIADILAAAIGFFAVATPIAVLHEWMRRR